MKNKNISFTICFLFNICFVIASFSYNSPIRITEILRDPIGNYSECPGDQCHEFVEILNISTDTFFIKDIFLTTDNESVDSLISWNQPISKSNVITEQSFLLPGQIGIILDRDFEDNDNFMFTQSPVLFTVPNGSIGTGLTRSSGVLIYSGTSTTRIDTLAIACTQCQQSSFSLPLSESEGYSIIPQSPLFKSTQWKTNPEKMTPGSIDELFIDGCLINYTCQVSSPVAVTTTFTLWQPNDVKNVSLEFYRSNTGVRIGSTSLVNIDNLWQASFLLVPDSLGIDYKVDPFSKAGHGLDISSCWQESASVVVTEIYPNSEFGPEWIEFYNNSSYVINLQKWYVTNKKPDTAVISEPILFNPQSYGILTDDRDEFIQIFGKKTIIVEPEHFPSLSNVSDTLTLYSSLRNQVSDKVIYPKNWYDHETFRSFQRIFIDKKAQSAENWIPADRSSPGSDNTQTRIYKTGINSLAICPVPFTPNNDGVDDRLSITYAITPLTSVNISIYSFDGRLIKKYAHISDSVTVWDGRESNGRYAAPGPFFVVGDFVTKSKRRRIRKKGILWR